LDNTM